MKTFDKFILLVKTGFMHPTVMPKTHYVWLDHMGIALEIDPVALPDDLVQAAKDFIAWRSRGDAFMPMWLKKYKEDIGTNVVIEQLEGVQLWWRNAEYTIDDSAPLSWKQVVGGRERFIPMNKLDAENFMKWARDVQGWDDENPSVRVVNVIER